MHDAHDYTIKKKKRTPIVLVAIQPDKEGKQLFLWLTLETALKF
jgi:hypothetical protein